MKRSGHRRPAPQGTQSVQRALELLDQLAQGPTPVSLRELARRMHLHPSTVSRLLAALETFDLVAQDPHTQLFSLGPRCAQLGQAFLERTRIGDVALPVMHALTRRLGLQSHLAVLQGGRLVHVRHADPPGYSPRLSEWQRYAPGMLHAEALGKVLLAWLPDDVLEAHLRTLRFEKLTARTIDNAARLRAELARVRRRGYAVDRGEVVPGVHCVAVPVWDHARRVAAAVSVSGTQQQIRRQGVTRLAAALRQAADQISEQLGVVS